MGHRESFGILGTPLHYGVAGGHKLSTKTKIAPTLTVYAKLEQTEIAKEERNLLESTSVLVTNGDNLYGKVGGCADPVELMDKEDITHFRVRETIKRNRMHTKSLLSLQHSGTSSFLAKSAEIPEIVPKQARTVHGYGVLQRIYSLRGLIESKVERKKVNSALQHTSLYSSKELFRESRKGLGYRYEEEQVRKSENSKISRTFRVHREKNDVKAFGSVTLSDYDNNEDDYMNAHANAGYKDLDSTVKLLSQRFQESRANSKGRSSVKKRGFSNVDHALEESVRVYQFSQSQVMDACLGEWTEYEIPASFTADPTHRFETGSMKTSLTNLPEYMRQEYAASLKLYTENRRKETEASRNAIANAKEEQHARSRRIRDLIVKDMGSRFIEPNELQTEEKASSNPERDEPGAMCKNSTTEVPKRGEARRTSQAWEPESLLCKRLGVETGQPILKLTSSKTESLGSRKLLSSYSDDEEFLIHSIAPVSAGILDLPDENILTCDQLAALHECENFHDSDVNVCNYGANRSSNQRLAQAIFTNAKMQDVAAQEPRGNMSSETEFGRNSKRNDRNRGVHGTRAMDFF